jgi:hypothetical protein
MVRADSGEMDSALRGFSPTRVPRSRTREIGAKEFRPIILLSGSQGAPFEATVGAHIGRAR